MDNLKAELKALLMDALNLEDVTPEDIADDMPLFSDEGLGLDSVDGLELGLALKKKYGVVLSADAEDSRRWFTSIDTLAQCVRELGKKA